MSEEGSVFPGRRLLLLIDCKPLFKRCGDASMQLLSSPAQQRAVGGILDEGVLEDEGRPLRAAAA